MNANQNVMSADEISEHASSSLNGKQASNPQVSTTENCRHWDKNNQSLLQPVMLTNPTSRDKEIYQDVPCMGQSENTQATHTVRPHGFAPLTFERCFHYEEPSGHPQTCTTFSSFFQKVPRKCCMNRWDTVCMKTRNRVAFCHRKTCVHFASCTNPCQPRP